MEVYDITLVIDFRMEVFPFLRFKKNVRFLEGLRL